MKILIRLRLAIILSAIVIIGGCASGSDEVCEPLDIACPAGGGAVQACCTSSSCRYIHNNISYPCDGTDCEETASTVVSVCLFGSSAAFDTGQYPDNRIETLFFREKAKKLVLRKKIETLDF